MNRNRLTEFRRWWNKNHHNKAAHHWLCKHSNRCMHNYMIAPEQFDYAKKILKRYHLSEYKRLNCEDAQFLWRLTHPTLNERRERLLASAAFFEQHANLKQMSK